MPVVDTKYMSGDRMKRLAGNTPGALALALDRVLYDGHVEPHKALDEAGIPGFGNVQLPEKCYVGTDGGCGWVAPWVSKDGTKDQNYVDVMKLLTKCRDELYAVAFGQL